MINIILLTLSFFIIIIIYYLMQKDIIVKAQPSILVTETGASFTLDNPPKNIGCSYESKPLSVTSNRMIEPIYCDKN